MYTCKFSFLSFFHPHIPCSPPILIFFSFFRLAGEGIVARSSWWKVDCSHPTPCHYHVGQTSPIFFFTSTSISTFTFHIHFHFSYPLSLSTSTFTFHIHFHFPRPLWLSIYTFTFHSHFHFPHPLSISTFTFHTHFHSQTHSSQFIFTPCGRKKACIEPHPIITLAKHPCQQNLWQITRKYLFEEKTIHELFCFATVALIMVVI